MKIYTVDLGFSSYCASTVHVEAENVDDAIAQALERAGEDCDWRSIDHCGDTFVWDIAEGNHPCAALAPSTICVPHAFTEAAALRASTDIPPALTERQLDTVLAALRHWQRSGHCAAPSDEAISAEHGDPLSPDEIDSLCESINVCGLAFEK